MAAATALRSVLTEDELRAIIDNAPVFLWSDLPDGFCDFLNQRWLNYFNLSLREAQGTGWATVLHPDDAAHLLESWQKSVSTGIPFETEARFRRPDGEYRWFLTRADPLRDKTGRIVKWYGTNTDIENLKRTEERLRQSEAYLAEAQRLSHTGTWVLNTTTMQYLYWSDESYRIWALDPLQGLPSHETVWQRIHPDDRDRVWEKVQEAVRQKKDYSGEFRIVLPNGTVKYLAATSHHLFSTNGELVEVIGTNVDVTGRKRVEEALRESEAKIRRLVDANILGICIWNLEGAIVEANEAFLHMLQYGREDVASDRLRWTDLTPAEWREWDERAVAELRSTGTFQPFEKEYFRKDGSRVPVLIGGALFEQSRNEGVAFVLDLTARKWAEEALRETEYKLRQIIDTVPSFLWSTGPDGVPTHVSRRVLDYSGMQFEDFMDNGWEAMLHPADFQETAAAFYHAIQTGTPYQAMHRLRRAADGEYRWHHARGEPLCDREGRIVQWYGLSIDIDERKKAEDRLRRSEALLSEAQMLSHCGASAYIQSKILYWSEGTYRIWGFDPTQGIPSREAVLQRLHPDDQSRMRAEAKRSFDEEKGPIEYRIVLPDGTVKHLESISRPIFSASGELVEVVAAHADVTERKRAEDLLRRSEAHLAEAQRLSHTGAVVYNGTAILYASEETYRIWGFDPAQGLPSRDVVFQRIHQGDRDRLNAEVRRAVDEKRKFSIGYRIVMPEGTVKYLETIGQPVFSASGELVEIFATQTDVTERKRAEEGLRDSEAKFRDYAETASDWFWEIGPDYKFTLLTENAFGSDSANRIGTACWDHALDLETEPEKWRAIQTTLDARRPFRDFVYCSAYGDGTPMYVRASGKPVFDTHGEFRGYRGTGTDVTAITRAQEALRESERRSRSAIDGIAGLVSILAPNGEVETVNRQCLEYFGRSLEELENWTINDAVHPEDLPRILELFKRAMASEIPFNFELRLRRFDGEYRWFDNRGVPIRDDSGRVARWYVLLTDIEDRTQALAQLDQMQSDLAHMNRVSVMGELAASLSHEITQPIASARNNARAAQNFLDMQPPDLGEVREALSCVVGDTDRAGDMIDRIRDQIKKAPPRKRQFDLNEAINEVIALGRSAIIKNSVSVQIRLSERLYPIQGDRVQLQQVLLNLLLNAVEAMGSSEAGVRELLISTELDHKNVLVAVCDSGPGIDPSHLEHVFDAFYTTKSSGMGMGLSICRSIIEAHGGRLWAEANEPRGAVFQFTLPAVQAVIRSTNI